MDRQKKNKHDDYSRSPGALPPLSSGRGASSFDAAGPQFRAMKIDSFKTPGIRSQYDPSSSKPVVGVSSGKKSKNPYGSSVSSYSPSEGNNKPLSPDFKPISVQQTWENPQLRPIPSYYPLECSNRVLDLDDVELDEITSNLSDAFRILSIQAKYLENPAGAALLTPELVEMHLYLWKRGDNQVCVEVQRRGGDSVTFHRYARHILEAASGDFDGGEYKDYSDSRYLKAAEKLLRTELSKSEKELEESLMAIEFAAGLLKKDRLDARMLGMESLCILTDPRKTCLSTAMLVCRAVILGNNQDEQHLSFTEIHEFVLNIVQKRFMIDEDSLKKDMIVDYDSDDEDFFNSEDQDTDGEIPPEYQNAMNNFVNYGLKILSNAWEVMTTFDSFDTEPEQTDHSQSLSIGILVDNFRQSSFNVTNEDILKTLFKEVSRAETRAHNACLAGKCLKILCSLSEHVSSDAGKIFGYETAIRAARIGKSTNARLEKECGELAQVLSG